MQYILLQKSHSTLKIGMMNGMKRRIRKEDALGIKEKLLLIQLGNNSQFSPGKTSHHQLHQLTSSAAYCSQDFIPTKFLDILRLPIIVTTLKWITSLDSTIPISIMNSIAQKKSHTRPNTVWYTIQKKVLNHGSRTVSFYSCWIFSLWVGCKDLRSHKRLRL